MRGDIGEMGILQDILGFRGIAPVIESQMEEKMENEMGTGMVGGLWFVGVRIHVMVLDYLYSYGIGCLI